MSSKSEVLSIATTTESTFNNPYILTLNESARPAGGWRYSLVNPAGTVTQNAGEMTGVDADVLLLYALAVALLTIPKGVTVEVRSTSHHVTTMGQRLTKPSPVPELPFLPFVESRRTAWEAVLPGLGNLASITWKTISRQ